MPMTNSGPNTNSSQFFITYRSCRHLDGKHTIFGKLVGGMETLNDMEKIEVNNKDVPIVDIFIEKAQVFVDPFQEAEEQLAAERAEEIVKKQREAEEIEKKKRQSQPLKVFREGVGKYLNMGQAKAENSEGTKAIASGVVFAAPMKKTKASNKLRDFSAW